MGGREQQEYGIALFLQNEIGKMSIPKYTITLFFLVYT